MKRALLLFLVVASSLLSVPARAGWVQNEVKWQITNQGGLGGTSIWIRDTSHTSLAFKTALDTTSSFTLDDAQLPLRGLAPPAGLAVGTLNTTNGSAADTTTIAYLIFASDSSVAFTNTLSSLTVLIDGRVGGYGPRTSHASGWVKQDSALVNGAAGGTLIVANESVAIPIRTISPYGSIFRWSELRARLSTATGRLAGARVFVRYWKP